MPFGDSRPNFARFDEYTKKAFNKDGEHPGATAILRRMKNIQESDAPKRDYRICVAPPPRKRRKK